ncbi:excinuclease ABC subunit UvrA [Amphibiibacter pelophylacis]|uniref:Excinuclease ABC subunit UvrA n=1 Tax=Amphibiibacter pelophylacis TaxID=1799477 RepID=A0ACC6P3K6_9BURK
MNAPQPPKSSGAPALLRLRGVRQNNLKNLDLDIVPGTWTVVTGVSGSGKSSLVFDTLYAEGQRRYVETFSAYARQFLDRMDKPQVDSVQGIPPAIAIAQNNPVRTSRSTVGTMTELNDYFKLLFARSADLFDAQTAQRVRSDDAARMAATLRRDCADSPQQRLIVTFAVLMPAGTSEEQAQQWLSTSGFTRIHARHEQAGKVDGKDGGVLLEVVADRFRIGSVPQQRLVEALEVALKYGHVSALAQQGGEAEGADAAIGGRCTVYGQADGDAGDLAAGEGRVWRFSQGLHCADSGRSYAAAVPAMFSFNSPYGACSHCRGFGRVIGVDWDLVVPDGRKSLQDGAVKTLSTPAWKECQDDLMRYAALRGVATDIAWRDLPPADRDWVIEGDPGWKGNWNRQWYGVRRFFTYLESKSYKMHIRVLLSKYRSYTTCPQCLGARLKPEALLWRIATEVPAPVLEELCPPAQRQRPPGVDWTAQQLQTLPGLNIADVMTLPQDRLRRLLDAMHAAAADRERREDPDSAGAAQRRAQRFVLEETRTRVGYLCDIGLGYLTLDRQSRTLSGGEVQRIHLTAALGSSLVNTLFVLDEPSIGLHPRDMDRVVRAMQRLRDAGNTLVVVEHDPAVMAAADRLIDIGPGPGERGGQIVFDGTPLEAAKADTLTGAYLGERLRVEAGPRKPVPDNTPRLILQDAHQHNLKHIDISLPLNRLVVLTGVSGSGKSTLVQDILAPALMRHFGQTSDTPGAHGALLGAEQLSGVAFVDQSPIGKTARSNPASFVGAFDELRKLLAAAPLARERGYTASHFSFNSGTGRCPACGGSGFEHVEMQFMSDVYLRCPDCDGARFRPEILQVTVERAGRGLNVADILALTVDEALELFATERDLLRKLRPLADVGLGYVRLGQPVPMLSGGEAQRLKLAGFLAETAARTSNSAQKLARKGVLYLFDEPTTGLHFDDIARLLKAMRQLVAAGHSVLVIEHNLDVMRNADWLIDLGPDGGDAGGQVVVAGDIATVMADERSHTGAALRQHGAGFAADVRRHQAEIGANPGGDSGAALQVTEPAAPWGGRLQDAIRVLHAREHNLKDLSVSLPHGQLNVITGVSGSGKSTLAFDIIFGEGQRRYLDSQSAYARSLVQPPPRPEVDAVLGVAPSVAIEQRLSRGGHKSTVATVTELWHFLRLLWVRLGVQHCVHDGTAVRAQSQEAMLAQIQRDHAGQHIGLLAPLVVQRKGLYTDLARQAKAGGATHLRVDGAFVPVAPWPKLDRYALHTLELPMGDLRVGPDTEALLRDLLQRTLDKGRGVAHVLAPLDGLESAMALDGGAGVGRIHVLSSVHACPQCGTGYAPLDPRQFSFNSRQGWCPTCVGTGLRLSRDQREALDDSQPDREKGREQQLAEADVDLDRGSACPDCQGSRLNAQARAVRFAGLSLPELARLTVDQALVWLEGLEKDDGAALSLRERGIARDVLPEIGHRLRFLQQVGLSYLTLDRGAPTLSGGEAQRIRLAAQLGSRLQGVCYVLDEPTIGLHPRDNGLLLGALRRLKDQGNTLVVVEHDAATIRQADHIIDIGPGAGQRGGQVVAQGTLADIMATPGSLTGQCLRDSGEALDAPRRPVGDGSHPVLNLKGATLHNLNDVAVSLPLQRLVAITGVSGSGKSSLARDVLLRGVQEALRLHPTPTRAEVQALAAKSKVWFDPVLADVPGLRLQGLHAVARVLEVDQTPIGKTPRSCPATYVDFWSPIRAQFAQTLDARARGYTAARFSFNTGPGRCPACEGQGWQTLAMSFLPDVKVLCDVCRGQRFNAQTLAVTWRGKSIGEVLEMTVDDALDFFEAMPAIRHPLKLLQDVGLGYLTLGQPSPTLSGGEAQRIKLVSELVKVRDDPTARQKAIPTLYVLDEPTVGLHMADVRRLIGVLHRLVAAGHSVVVIEHDLELVAAADWVIDLGPEGGSGGGQIIAQAAPADLARMPTHTGRALAGEL